MDQYDIFVTGEGTKRLFYIVFFSPEQRVLTLTEIMLSSAAHLIRQVHGARESFTVHIQKASSVVSEKNILLHTFSVSDAVKAQSEEVYIGRLGIHEEINIVFQNESNDFLEDVTIPIICLKSDNSQPELTLCGDSVELKVLFVLDQVFIPKSESSPTQPTKFVPSSRAYQTIRNGVIAVANTRHLVGDSVQALTGSVQYAVDSSRFVVSIGYNLSTDFLTNVDILFGEGCQVVDSHLDAAKNVLVESLLGLTRSLHRQLGYVDELVSQKIRVVLRRLKPLVSRLISLAHPYVSLALYLTGPARQLMVPFVQPFVDKALSVHEGLQQNFLVGPIVSTATSHAWEVIGETVEIYNSFEAQGSEKVKKL